MVRPAHPIPDHVFAMKILEKRTRRRVQTHMGIYVVDLGRDSATPHGCQKRDEVWIGK